MCRQQTWASILSGNTIKKKLVTHPLLDHEYLVQYCQSQSAT